MKSIWFLALVATILGLALFSSSLPVSVSASTPSIKLVLGGTGATPWAIGPVAPGDSGTQTVILSNTGFSNGAVTIWISDIVNSEGTNPQSETGDVTEPGELGDYLMLNVSNTNLSTNFTLPATSNNFPQGEIDIKHIYINPLRAFSTLTLQWEWRLPPETGDDIQGDTLSFTINYMLEEFPPVLSVPPVPSLPPIPQGGGGGVPQVITSVGITMTGPSGVSTGFTTAYTLTITNTGTVVLNGVTVTDELPEGLRYQSSIPDGIVTGSQIAWNLGILNIGETKEIVIILGGVKSGAMVNTASVTTREGSSARTSLGVMVLAAATSTDNRPEVDVSVDLLPPILVPTQAPLSNVNINGVKDTVRGTSPPLLPTPLGIKKVMSVWWIFILAIIGEAALVYYMVILMRRRRKYHTTGHQKRVAELASAIAREMNLSEKLVKMLLLFGSVQSTGSQEMAYPAAQTALQYHERLNGSGYPQKLVGDDILLEARILAVADTVETMSSPRPNRPAVSMTKAVEEIKKYSSTLYDSEVVKACVRLIDRGNFRFQTHYI